MRPLSTVALALCVSLTLSACGGGSPGARTARRDGESRPVLALPSAEELRRAGSLQPERAVASSLRPDQLMSRSETLIDTVPQLRYDLDARAQTLGPGTDPAFHFVRDQIRYESYPGALRGAEGTYTARAGNAVDRSLLLADLLRQKGIPTRFAIGRLPRPEAERLFARIFEPERPLEADAVLPAGFSPLPEAAAFASRLRTRALRDYAAIRAALGDTLPVLSGPSQEDILREMETHVWIQAQAEGRWIDLDTAFADATPGRAYASAERTVEALPADARQQVTVRVVVETLAGASLETAKVLEVTAPADELLDRQIFLLHAPGAGGGLQGAIEGAVRSAEGGEVWTPVLLIEEQEQRGEPVTYVAGQQPPERGGPPSGGLRGIFGPGGALASGREFVAEWLEIEILLPDGRRDLTRRALVNRAGAAWRQKAPLEAGGLRPLERDAAGITAPRAIHNIWFSAGRHDLAGYAAALTLIPDWVKATADKAKAEELGLAHALWPAAMQSFAFLVRSDHLVVPALNDSPEFRFYADTPRVLIVSLIPPPQGAPVGMAFLYDLRRDHIRGLAREGARQAGVVERKLWFGALEGALEHETGAELAVGQGADPSHVESTSALLSAEGATALRPGASASNLQQAVPDAAARMTQTLAAGAVLVVPRRVLRGGPAAWWEIAPGTADTRAVLGDDLNATGIRGVRGRSHDLPGDWAPKPKVRKPIKIPKRFRPPPPPPDPCKKGGPEYAGVVKCVVIPLVKVAAWTAVTIAVTWYAHTTWNNWLNSTSGGVQTDGRR